MTTDPAHAVLRPIGDSIWEFVQPFRLMGAELGRRLTVVRLPDGRLWLHAPPSPSPSLTKALQALGPVAYIVGPNRVHDTFLDEFTRANSSAEFHAAPGLEISNPRLRPTHRLGPNPPRAWAGVIEQRLVDGMPKLNEFVFFHRPSASLIVADLVFNIRAPKPWLTRVLMTLNGRAFNRVTPTRIFRSLISDRTALRRSIETILAWDFRQIVVGHGENVTEHAKDTIRDAFAFLQ